MTLRARERLGYRLFGKLAENSVKSHSHLPIALQRAHIPVRPDVYMATTYLMAAGVAAVVLVPLLVAAALSALGIVDIPPLVFVFMLPAPFVMAAMVYLFAILLPDMRALSRSRDIDAKLPYALNYIATMASAGATPEVLFAGLAKQPVYGQVAAEAAWIVRDLRLLGSDLIAALSRAIDRTPSARFQDFLQGAITALSSGGDLKIYFTGKADQYIYENRQEQKKFLEGLGVLAESFVVVVVAAPLFLIVILSVMTSFGGSAESTLVIGYALVFALIPLSQAGFAWTVKVMTPEA